MAGSLSAGAAAGQSAKRPNIVVIMADDMGFSDLGCYGGEIATPNLDRLAKGGVRFTQFYNTARCCPTRASLLTGLYSHQAGVGHMVNDRGLPGYRGNLNRQSVTIAEALRPARYHTLMCGKWHVTPVNESKDNWPLQRGFEKYYGTIHGAGSFFNPVSLTDGNTPTSPDREDYYYTDAISDRASGFIGEYARKEDPFFMYVAYTSPHWPLHARDADIAKYRGRYKGGWDALRLERHRRMIDMGIVDRKWPLTPRDEAVPTWKDAVNKEWQARRMEVYAAQIDRMDQGIGRILARLRETGAEQNTLVLFLADNGGCAEELTSRSGGLHVPKTTRDGRPVAIGNDPSIMPGPDTTYQSYGIPWANASNTPFRLYKHWVNEGGIATPCIAHWPGGIRQSNRISTEPGHLIDVMATCIDVSGSKYPEEFGGNRITPLEGRSLLPVLQGGRREGHERIYWEHEGNRAVRQGRWKLVSRHPNAWELYDLEADRTEMKNLAGSQPAKARELAAKYEQWAARCGVEPWGTLPRPLAQRG
ncbi:MAG: arylsulfatase [Bryobacteraceae bacterium]